MESPVLTFEMMAVLGLLSLTIFLFVSEIVRIDLAAILILVLLGGYLFFNENINQKKGTGMVVAVCGKCSFQRSKFYCYHHYYATQFFSC